MDLKLEDGIPLPERKRGPESGAGALGIFLLGMKVGQSFSVSASMVPNLYRVLKQLRKSGCAEDWTTRMNKSDGSYSYRCWRIK
jgi:hypothetical protein